MAGKPKPMSQIKQLIILNRQGKSTKTIARLLGMSKNTVKAYLFKLDKLLAGTGTAGNTAEKLLRLGEPEVYALFHPGIFETANALSSLHPIPHRFSCPHLLESIKFL